MSVQAIAKSVRGRERTAVEVAADCLARADAYDAVQPQTWIARLEAKQVISRAAAVDDRVARGEDLPLAGVPFAVKDNIDLAGLPTTAACPAFAYQPSADAAVVARLVAAGAVPIGKTNLDQFATGLTGVRSPHGAPGCVFNRAFISGGSSSGSAVAVAAGIVPVALGSDTAGSGRGPAAFNGLVGFKPTRGRWSTRGLVPACRSVDCVSVFTADLADAALVDAQLVAFGPDVPFSRSAPATARLGIGSVGVPRTLDGLATVNSSASTTRRWTAPGPPVCGGSRSTSPRSSPPASCSTRGRGSPSAPPHSGRSCAPTPACIHPIVRAIMIQAGAGISAAEAFEGFHAQAAHEQAARAIWAEVDALLLPTVPAAYRISEVLAEPFALNAHLGLFTNFVNLLDMAAINAPAGFRDDGVGFGVSVIGPAWSEARLLAVAEQIADPGPRPPLDLAERTPTVKLAVVGAHLGSMPLHWQLASRQARLVRACRTAPVYRLYALAGTSPPKPALVHAGPDGAAIEVEVYEVDTALFGGFVADVPAPLAIGTVTLEDGENVKGFVAEPRATLGATDMVYPPWRLAGVHRPKITMILDKVQNHKT